MPEPTPPSGPSPAPAAARRRALAAALLVAALAGAAAGQTRSPFATRVLAYEPAPGQRVRDPQFNDPARALGPPGPAGGLSAGDNAKCVTLGGFGGSITLGFDRPVWRSRHNPHGMDFVVFGNAFYVGGDASRRHVEAGVVEVSRDDNHNGLADDHWYLIPGSHLAPAAVRTAVGWDSATLNPTWVPAGKSGQWTTSGYPLPTSTFTANPVMVCPSPPAEAVWGYADSMPTLKLGDMDADDAADDPGVDPAVFYTVPDDPLSVGVTPGSGGGAAFSIAWAVDPGTGAPAALDRIDFVRITTGVNASNAILGEVSTEVSGVADVRPLYTPDWDGTGSADLLDIFAFLADWFAGAGEDGGADFDASGETDLLDIFAFLEAWFSRP